MHTISLASQHSKNYLVLLCCCLFPQWRPTIAKTRCYIIIKIVKCNSTVNSHPAFRKASSYSFVILLFMSWSFTYSSFTLNSIEIIGRPTLDSIDRGLNMDSLLTSTPFVWRYQFSSTSFMFFALTSSQLHLLAVER